MAGYTFENVTDTDFETIFSVNFYGPVNCIKAVLPIMKEQGSGNIINITSKSGMMKYNVVPGMISYGSAKAALTRFTEVLAFELMCSGSPIRINALSPGMVAVSYHENLPEEEKALFRRPEDIRMSLLKILDDSNPASGETFTEDYTTWQEELSGTAQQ
jgi:NAD(P)-dependent dehydrogenase (short-subunit alcohol dehydrogenase family)